MDAGRWSSCCVEKILEGLPLLLKLDAMQNIAGNITIKGLSHESKQTLNCSKPTIETPLKGVKCVWNILHPFFSFSIVEFEK